MKVMKINCDTNSSTICFEYAIPNDWIFYGIKVFGSHTSLHIIYKNPFNKIELESFDLCNYNQSIGEVPPISRIDLGRYDYDADDSCCILTFSLQTNV